eukprot:TRINITY_DN7715_c0_g1_i1.p1 TRINITY_DN7715_c0_g1~~TRINITY_DN7715_c0_g1_i1.p1  ORF type:complete len:327 (-),score=59.33 TRINITY_DN7715_c0_g1_i1:162-1142(-)
MEEVEDEIVPPASSAFTAITGKPDPAEKYVIKKDVPVRSYRHRKPTKASIHHYDPDRDVWSPIPSFSEGEIHFDGGKILKWGPGCGFKNLMFDSGSSPGLACDTSLFDEFVGSNSAWAPTIVDVSHETEAIGGRVALVRVIIKDIGLDTWTFATEAPGVDQPVLGRFLLGDCLNLVMKGQMAPAMSLRLNQGKLDESTPLMEVGAGFYSVTQPYKSWEEIKEAFRKTAQFRQIYTEMREEHVKGSEFVKAGSYQKALTHFQTTSVYGYFVFDKPQLGMTWKALSVCYRKTGKIDLALAWAERAVGCNETYLGYLSDVKAEWVRHQK